MLRSNTITRSSLEKKKKHINNHYSGKNNMSFNNSIMKRGNSYNPIQYPTLSDDELSESKITDKYKSNG